jgi:hypothetical protein
MVELPVASRERYKAKVINAGLTKDHFNIDEWTSEPEKVPNMTWSDVTMYMVATPSPYTKEAIKI